MSRFPAPTVSVIMIFLDAERFIEESIRSVLGQTLKEFELILVDDGSRDRGTHIARDYAGRYPHRIRYLEHAEHANLGMSASHNSGIREARGRLIGFLDSDDVWLPTMLEESVAFLDAYPAAHLTYSATTYWHGWTGRPEDLAQDWEWKPSVATGVLIPPPKLLTRILGDGWLGPCICSLFVRREFALRIGGFEERFRKQFADQGFLAKALLQGAAVLSDANGNWYRQHSDSGGATAARTGTVAAARKDYFTWLDGYVRRHGFGDPDLRSALDAARAVVGVVDEVPEPLPPATGSVHFGDFRRVTPFSRIWGFDRGAPVDRFYIERFLERNCGDIRGEVLEIKDAAYTRRFGGKEVTRSEVLDLSPTPEATIVGDLTDEGSLPSDRFDCIILTQTLQLVYDVEAALLTIHRMLRPGGTLLLTVPGITPLDHTEAPDSWYWSFTPRSVRRLLEEGLWTEIDVEGNGNVLTAAAFLYGMANQELLAQEYAVNDADYPVLITARARKPSASRGGRGSIRYGRNRRNWRSLLRGEPT